MPRRRASTAGVWPERFPSGGPWEEKFGYVRAIRIGGRILVSGTTAAGAEGAVEGGSSIGGQTASALRRIDRALRGAGGQLRDVVRTRVFVTDIRRWAEVAEAHRAAFGEHRPVSTLVEVRQLIRPDLLVEVEAEACVPPERRPRARRPRTRPGPARPRSARARHRPS
jgi:enamine deaminase RidA (YjgF/YER057c/UK114 family)